MEQLKLGIKRNNHIFSIKLMPFRRFMNFTSWYGEYELNIRFLNDKDKRASVRCKNLVFTGAITSIKNWLIELKGEQGRQSIISMRNGKLYLSGESSKTNVCNQSIDENLCVGECENVDKKQSISVFQECINVYSELFNQIINKKVFQEQLIDLIDDVYYDYDTEMELIEDFREYFVSFINAEGECCQLSQLITVDDVLGKFPNLQTLKIKDINHLIEDSIEMVANEYKEEIDIYYSRDVVLEDIYENVLQEVEERRQIQFQKKYSNDKEIKKLLGDKILPLKDLSPLFKQIYFLMEIGEIKDKNSLLSKVDDLISQCKNFEELWEDCDSFNHNKIIVLTDEKLEFFEGVDKGVNNILEEDKEDYIVYKIVIPHYYSTLYNKKRTKLKPTIEKLTQYVDYVKNIVAVLIENALIVKKGEKLYYNLNENLVKCKQEILSIERFV